MGGRRLPHGWTSIVNWGGVRGSIPVALALGLPTAGMLSADLRSQLIAIVFGAVFLSLVIQGTTIKGLLARFGLIGMRDEERAYEDAIGRIWSSRAEMRALEIAHRDGDLAESTYQALKNILEESSAEAARVARRTARENVLIRERQLARSSERMVLAGRSAIEDAFRRGLLSEEIADRLKEEMDARLVQGGEVGWNSVWGIAEPEPPTAEESESE
jgi:CPA1 family monovalent cation:H+ antiporter